MKKIISFVGFIFILNLSFAQSYSAWYRYGSSLYLKQTELAIILPDKTKTQVYKYQDKFCYVQVRFEKTKAYWRRVYLKKSTKFTKFDD